MKLCQKNKLKIKLGRLRILLLRPSSRLLLSASICGSCSSNYLSLVQISGNVTHTHILFSQDRVCFGAGKHLLFMETSFRKTYSQIQFGNCGARAKWVFKYCTAWPTNNFAPTRIVNRIAKHLILRIDNRNEIGSARQHRQFHVRAE